VGRCLDFIIILATGYSHKLPSRSREIISSKPDLIQKFGSAVSFRAGVIFVSHQFLTNHTFNLLRYLDQSLPLCIIQMQGEHVPFNDTFL
jgi:hypothetical protein